MTAMNRRDAVKAAGAMLGGVVVLGTLPGCGSADSTEKPPEATVRLVEPRLLSADDEALLADFADTLLPDTYASPGAKAAGCGAAMNLLLTDCRDTAGQQRVLAALTAFRTRAPGFAAMLQPDREALLRAIDAEAVKAGPAHWFHLLRDLALTTYFSSEVGVTKALRYVREPGRYLGCVPLKPGQPAWS
ncbi:MAG: gluconate 2-dehydrogenase subunit 3 family protein [Gemmatimonadota bacterium]